MHYISKAGLDADPPAFIPQALALQALPVCTDVLSTFFPVQFPFLRSLRLKYEARVPPIGIPIPGRSMKRKGPESSLAEWLVFRENPSAVTHQFLFASQMSCSFKGSCKMRSIAAKDITEDFKESTVDTVETAIHLFFHWNVSYFIWKLRCIWQQGAEYSIISGPHSSFIYKV